MNTQSPEIAAFYKALADWINNGMPDGGVFNKARGICSNVFNYELQAGLVKHSLAHELRQQFAEAGLDSDTPFNDKRKGFTYKHECDQPNANLFLNPKRVAWVHEHA